MQKRLYRSRTNRILGGVCGGLGDYFEIDPVIIRLVWAATFFVGGVGLVFYIIAWIIIPEAKLGSPTASAGNETAEETVVEDGSVRMARTPEQTRQRRIRGQMLLAGALVIIGGLLLLDQFFSIFDWKYIIGFGLLAAGIFFIFRYFKEDREK
ncbi:MAG TPA: PspC domain-containing protein [Thermotogota bacterium]|nr:PspC domain-containing protein [Thermotogota bacterium]HRW93556.1 PspC domain-containing protein [Thermotogota bacterium]